METVEEEECLAQSNTFTFHTGQMETERADPKIPDCCAVHIPHRSDGDLIEAGIDYSVYGGSHSTQVRWRRIFLSIMEVLRGMFTFHTGQMET